MAATPAQQPSPFAARRARRRSPGWIRSGLTEIGDLTAFAGSALWAVRTTPKNFAEALRQSAILVRGSTPIIAALIFLFSVSAINFSFYLLRALGASDYTGLTSGILVTRGVIPLMFGWIFAAKVGCGIVSELGAMKINEEIAALEAEAVDPMEHVVAPRIVAAILYMPIVTLVGLVAGTIGAFWTAVVVLQGLSSSAFWRYHWGVQALSDQVLTFAAVGVLGLAIVIASCFYGLRARGGPAGVGVVSARSLVVNLILVHTIVPGYLAICYGADAHLPIGG